MTRLYIIRHGATDWNECRRLQGQQDIPLNSRGREQAAQMALRLAEQQLEAIYSSDLLRARQTAEAISKIVGAELQMDARLREVHLGEWEGKLVSEIEEADGDRFERRFRYPATTAPPGGEPTCMVQERILAAVHDISTRHPAGAVAVVSHGFAVAALRAYFDSRDLQDVWDLIPENGEIYEISINVDQGLIKKLQSSGD